MTIVDTVNQYGRIRKPSRAEVLISTTAEKAIKALRPFSSLLVAFVAGYLRHSFIHIVHRRHVIYRHMREMAICAGERSIDCPQPPEPPAV